MLYFFFVLSLGQKSNKYKSKNLSFEVNFRNINKNIFKEGRKKWYLFYTSLIFFGSLNLNKILIIIKGREIVPR